MVTPAEPVLKTKMEDMGSLRAPKTGGGKGAKGKDAFDILKEYFAKTYGSQINPDQFMDQFARIVQSGMIKLVQIGDTVFGIMPKPNGVAQFYIATVEPMSALPERIAAFNKTLKNMGFKQAVSYADTPEWDQIYKQAGVPVKTSRGNMSLFGSSMPKFQFSWELA